MNKWPIKLLGELCDVVGGNAAPQGDENYKDGIIPFVRMKDLGRPHFTNNLTETDDKLTEASATVNRMKFFEPGCILFPRSGSVALNHRAILGVRACIVSHIGVLQNLRPEVTPGFLYLYLTTFNMTALSKKTTGVDSIAFADVNKIPVPVPPLAEQERIVKLLDEADELRKLRAQADYRTANLIPAIFQEMFGDPLKNPKGWQVVNIEKACKKVTDGTHNTPAYVREGVPLVTSKNLRAGTIDFSDIQYISRFDHEAIIKRSHAESGDILFAMIGTIGNAAVVADGIEISIKNVGLFKPDPALVLTKYLHTFLCYPSFVSNLLASAKGITQKFVGLGMLRSISLPLPPLALQKQFAQRITEIRDFEASQATSHTRLDALFQSMLHRAFNGEL